MSWWNLSPVRTIRSRVRLGAEALEERATPAAMTVYEATELQVMNQFRANPVAFANDLKSLYLGGGYVSPYGYAATDPIWADIRASINATEAATAAAGGVGWRSGFTGSTVGTFYEHAIAMPAQAPLVWDSGMQDGAISHTQWMYSNCYAHAGFTTTTPLNSPETTNPILGLPRFFPTYAQFFDLTGYSAGGENISYAANADSNAFNAFQLGQYTVEGYYQRAAYADVIGFMLENNNGNPASPWGHLDNIGSGGFNVVGISSRFYENTYYEGGANGVNQSYFGTHRFGNLPAVTQANLYAYVDTNNNNNFDVGEGLTATINVTGTSTASVVLLSSGYATYQFPAAGGFTFTATLGGVPLGTPQSVTSATNRNIFFRISSLIDTTLPVSSVNRLPAFDSTTSFTVRWTGADPGSPSTGVGNYDVYASVDGAPFTQWLNDVVTTSAVYTGSLGHTYSFYSVATDFSGLREAAPASADTTVTLQAFSATKAPPNLGGIAQSLAHSDEAYSAFITQAYQTYLGRGPDSTSLATWLASMRTGDVTDEELEASIIGSAEYINANGGLGMEWILSMYTDLLGRVPTTQELINWYSQIVAGADPVAVAYGFAASGEREAVRVTTNYQTLLGRTPNQAEVNSWVDLFVNQGMTNETMRGAFTGSSEYFSGLGQSSAAAWVSAAFTSLLNRAATPADVAAYTSQILPPNNLTGVAHGITHSNESYTNFITQAYNDFLNRAPDAAGLSFWLGSMASGAVTDEGLEAQLIGSPEYIVAHGGAGAGWVNGLYTDLLGRTPSTAEVNNWVAQLSAGISPYSVAYGFAASAERESQKVIANMQAILGRTPSTAEVNFWVNQFNLGMNNETMRGIFAGSTEDYIGIKASNSQVRWIDFAYFDLLGRAATQADINALLGSL